MIPTPNLNAIQTCSSTHGESTSDAPRPSLRYVVDCNDLWKLIAHAQRSYQSLRRSPLRHDRRFAMWLIAMIYGN